MLNSCDPALSQGDGSDFHPRWDWEATPPGYRACVRTWRWLAPCHGAHTCPDLLWQPSKAGGIRGCWQVQLNVGGVRNVAAKEGGHWDLNPGQAAIGERTMRFRSESERTMWFWGALFATRLRQQERLCREEKGRVDSCWWSVRRCHMALD